MAIRVLQIFTIMNRGGAESMIMNYYRQIDRNKIQFDFLVHREEKGAFDDEIHSLGGKIYRLPPINPFFPNSYYKTLRNFFNTNNNYRAVHSHLNTFSSFPLKIAKEFDIPCRIAHAHIAIDNIGLKSFLNSKEAYSEIIKKLIKLQLRKRIHKYPTHLFSCGNKAGKWLFGETTKFTLMNNAIDSKCFAYNEELSQQLKNEYGLAGKLVIGHVGRFTSQKNHDFLLKIFASIKKQQTDSALVLVGDGLLRHQVELQAKQLKIEEDILFMGVQGNIPELLQMFDVFVFPSFYEGLPVTIIEAQAAGLAIYASDTITKEVEITSNIEFISLEHSPEQWAHKILDNLDHKRTNKQAEIVEVGYDIKANAKFIEEFYLQHYTIEEL